MRLSNTLIDNSCCDLRMTSFLKQLINTPDCREIMIATGFWDMPGMSLVYNELAEFLKRDATKLRLLIGKDPNVFVYQQIKPEIKDLTYPEDYIKKEIYDLELKEEYQKVVDLLLSYCDDTEQSKIEIRVYRNQEAVTQFLHSKCYIFECGSCGAYGIIGSSNFTQKGLEGNAELNYLETTPHIVKFQGENSIKGHIGWFNEKWEQSQPWNKIFLEEILKEAPITRKIVEKRREKEKLTPYELYIKLLQYKFGDLVDTDSTEVLESYLPVNFDKLGYQIDAVKQCFSIMRQHGGFMLADVVGLGKTLVGVMVVKYFLEHPDLEGRERKVLIVTPPAIQSAWKYTIEEFDKGRADKIGPAVDYITTGSIGKLVDDELVEVEDNLDSGEFAENLKQETYGLILIDESHKFRNSSTAMYQALDNLIMQIGCNTGFYPYVGLLSATPQNNHPDDLKNQIYLFQRDHSYCTLEKVEGRNLERFFSEVGKRYNALLRIPDNIAESSEFRQMIPEERNAELIELSKKIRDTVLCDILVRRTRTDVQKYYTDDLQKQHIVFPQISGPHSLRYNMEPGLARLFAETMELIAPKVNFLFDDSQYLCYYRYRAIQFLVDQHEKDKFRVRNLDADRFSRQLARIMQIGLVKRLESSFAAFKSSLRNLRQYTENMIDMWEHDAIFVCPQIDVNHELDRRKHWQGDAKHERLLTFEECAADIRAKIKKLDEAGKNDNARNKEYTRQDFDSTYIELLRKDYELIKYLYDAWNAYSDDPKLEVFKEQLTPVLFDKGRNPAQKLVIFSEAISTVEALKLVVERKNYKVLLITAKNRKESESVIRENFDANYSGEWKDDYQVIITTEVLAEGVNLHRANCILNYDTPWNSTRLMQRIGRVNRIGSTAPYVYVYNFLPSTEGDNEIRLVQKAYTKLQSFHTLFGEDSKIYSQDEQVSHYELNKFVNGEESPYEQYIYQLKRYKAEHPERYVFLQNKNDGLELAVPEGKGCQYFVIRTSKISGLFVKNTSDGKASVVPGMEMFKEFYTAQDVVASDLPEDWAKMKKSAVDAFNQHMARMNIRIGKDKRATRAKEIIIEMAHMIQMSDESRQLLESAFRLVNKGNWDVIRKITAIHQQLTDMQGTLLPITQDEIDEIIRHEIERMVVGVQKQIGEATVFMGLAK